MKKILYSILTLVLGLVLSGSGCNVDALDPDTIDAGVEINGVTWATRNVAAFGKFAKTPEDPGMFYQWNRKIGWSATDPLTPSETGATWNSTPATGDTWTTGNNPCPPNWKVPTKKQLESLATANKEYGTYPGTSVKGIYLGTAPNRIFLPVVGWRSGINGSLFDNGIWGGYRSSVSSGANLSWQLGFDAVEPRFDGVGEGDKYDGLSVRCVK
jgi:hypothetical protein